MPRLPLYALLALPFALTACDGGKDGSTDDTSATSPIDADGDGSPADEDCDDNDNLAYPGADEVCDGADNDCDGEADEDPTDGVTRYADNDADGYGDASGDVVVCEGSDGYVPDATDCDDSDDAIWPGADELCDGADNDCDGETDEVGATDGDTYHADADGDGYGHPANTVTACAPGDGAVEDATDCDDSDATRFPGAPEECDGDDDDCDGETDEIGDTWYLDEDGDGYGVDDVSLTSCDEPSGYAAEAGDCDDDSSRVHPDATERCDELDNDCDDEIDEACEDGGDFEGVVTYQMGEGSDPGDRTCVILWDSIGEPASHSCPECEWSYDAVWTMDEDASYGVDDCLDSGGPYDYVEWEISWGYDADYHGEPMMWYYLDYYGTAEWYPIFYAKWDETTGDLRMWYGDYEERTGRGYYTNYWVGELTVLPD